MTRRILVRVPATTGNIGPGFDVWGIAWNLSNEAVFTFSPSSRRGVQLDWEITGEGAESLPRDKSNLIYRAMDSLLGRQAFRKKGIKLHISLHNRIPLSRGLGSSAAAILIGLLAANWWSKGRIDTQLILNLSARLEGHADNVAAALFGGLVGVRENREGWDYCRLPFSSRIGTLVVIPEKELETALSRSVLKKQRYSLKEIVPNLGNLLFLREALAKADFPRLSGVVKDFIHQPYRIRLFPVIRQIFGRAEQMGARGAVLSGAGPSVLLFYDRQKDDPHRLGKSLVHLLGRNKVKADFKILKVNRKGAETQWI